MNFYLAVTDISWYNYLSKINPEDVNFWQPGGRTNFRILSPGEPFLFKLKVHNVIGGVGFFSNKYFCHYHWHGRLSEKEMVLKLIHNFRELY